MEGEMIFRRKTRSIAITGITAAAYAVLTLAVAPLGFGPIQFRFSEMLLLLILIDAGYGPGLVLGCAIANCFSPLGIVDVIVGTAATVCTVTAMAKTPNALLASLWPTIFCVFVGAELSIVYQISFLLTTATVMAGEFVVVTLLGYPLFRKILKNKALVEALRIRK